MFYDAVKNNHGLPLEPLKSIVAPRPIAWVSTVSTAGIANLAPYSFFNAFNEDPTYIAFGSGGEKDSVRNARETGEFAVNLVTHDLREAMNASSASVALEVDEFALAGLSKAPCRFIKAPRVAESPVCLECRLFQIVDLPDDEGRVLAFMVIILFHSGVKADNENPLWNNASTYVVVPVFTSTFDMLFNF